MVQNHPILSGNTIRKIMKNFKALKNVLNRSKGHSGRLGPSVLKPIFSSFRTGTKSYCLEKGPHRTCSSLETYKNYVMEIACNLAPLC